MAAENMNELLYGDNAQPMKVAPAPDLMDKAKANWPKADDQLVGEFLYSAENAIGWFMSFPMSQVQAVVRRLQSTF